MTEGDHLRQLTADSEIKLIDYVFDEITKLQEGTKLVTSADFIAITDHFVRSHHNRSSVTGINFGQYGNGLVVNMADSKCNPRDAKLWRMKKPNILTLEELDHLAVIKAHSIHKKRVPRLASSGK